MSNLLFGGNKGIISKNGRTRYTGSHTTRPNPVPGSYYQRASHPEYIDRAQRLVSFTFWRHSHIQDPTKLADSGFFYTGEGDLVRCHFCSLGLRDFHPTHEPLRDHVLFSENCEFLVQHLGPSRLKEIKESQLAKAGVPNQTSSFTTTERNNLKPQASGGDSDTTIRRFRHPEYTSFSVRLASYTGWPRTLVQTPQQLAEAGFYYTGTSDIVRCFSCDGGLEKWDPEDDPWIEHSANFPHCAFLKDIKGDKFISLAISYRIRPKSLVGVQPSGEQTEMPSNNYPENNCDNVVTKLEEMGYSRRKTLQAMERVKKGRINVTVESVVDMLENLGVTSEENQENQRRDLMDEHSRLIQELYCMQCKTADINTLFLPCQHHRLCTHCAERVARCPVCDAKIAQKIRTFRP